MVSSSGGELPGAVARLRDEADGVRLPLDLPGADEARRTRRELVAQLDDYVLPRLREPDAPLLAVVGGSTGAGRSTLVNSLVGREVSPAGVLRPTTRVPVLVCRAADRRWFSGTRVLPGLRRVAAGATTGDEGPAVVLQVDDRIPEGLAVLDIPDVDSVDSANRDLAVRLLGAADVWVFVTTAARYADAVPWHILRVARERTAEIGIVLDRVPEEDLDEVRAHFEAMLTSAGLGSVPLFLLPESTLRHRMLTRDQVAPVRNWLYGLAVDPDVRAAALRRTLGGALGSLPRRAGVLGRAAGRQHEAAAALAACAERAYAAAVRHADHSLCSGALLTGDVLAAWRAWHASGLPEAGAAAVEQALAHGTESLLRDIAERAAGLTDTCWRGRPGGVAMPSASKAEAYAEAAEAVRAWHRDTDAQVPAGLENRRRAAVLLTVAALTDPDGEAGAQARDLLPAGLADQVEPARNRIRECAAAVLGAARERQLGAVRALRTDPAEGLHQAMSAVRRAG
ncbi:dynamin family protein [Yinghuangia soli]|uniref:Dynamin family protein n=1 Tax=Yinghuangia soli TaxID=2908204 RepID=A0AA41Q6Q6_9ACTN|nr:dynamin family protein [Yinghuangia soli]MCF2531711.1 dynamin family protein [Yinghuangia soli]